MTAAQAAGVEGVDWFVASDGAVEGASTDPYDYMGLYRDVSQLGSPEEAQRTETGWAYRTLGTLLAGALHDPAATEALALPEAVGGAAFRLPDMRQALVLWAKTGAAGESASATYELTTTRGYAAHAWDWSQTQASEALSPEGGKITLTLGATPQIFVEQ